MAEYIIVPRLLRIFDAGGCQLPRTTDHAAAGPEIGSQFATGIEGTCIKHRFGKCSLKMYDKHGIVLRIETTTNDVSFFKHHRKVEHRQGPPTRDRAGEEDHLQPDRPASDTAWLNRRYLAHLSALDDFSAGVRSLGRLAKPREVEGRSVKGLNFCRTSRHCWTRSGTKVTSQVPPRRFACRFDHVLADAAIAATGRAARHRCGQACCRNLPLLLDQRRPSRHRCGGSADRGHYHSGIDLMGFFAGCDLTRTCQVPGGKDCAFPRDAAVEKWPLRGSPATSRRCHWRMLPRHSLCLSPMDMSVRRYAGRGFLTLISIGDKHSECRGNIGQWQRLDVAGLPRRGHFSPDAAVEKWPLRGSPATVFAMVNVALDSYACLRWRSVFERSPRRSVEH